MKTTFLIISLIYTSLVYGQWNEIATFPSHNFFDIECVNEYEVYVVGTDSINGNPTGVIHHTLNGGASWDTVHFHDIDRIYSVNIVNQNIVYATGRGNRIYKTIDAGANWTNLSVPSGDPAVAIPAAHFFNEEVGLIGNFYGEIFKTTNRGLDWERTYFIQPYYSILDLRCPTAEICYASTALPRFILKSIDGGNTWNLMDPPPFSYTPWALDAINRDTLISVFSDALIYRTEDGALTWDSIPSPVYTNFKDVYFVDNIGIAVGTQSAILKSTDYGSTWTVEQFDSTSYEWISAVHLANNVSGYACTLRGSIYGWGTPTSSKELEFEANKMRVFPNPFSDFITIDFEQPKNGIIEIYNSQGQLFRRIKVESQASIHMDLRNTTSDLVFISFREDGNERRIIKKLIKMN